MAEGRKVTAVDDDEEEFGDEDDAGVEEVDEEASLPLLKSTAEIATWSFEGGLSLTPRSFRRSADKRLVSPSLPPP